MNSRGQTVFVFIMLTFLGVLITWVAVHNMRDEVQIFVSRGELRAHGKTTIGSITSCEARTKTYGPRGRSYTYYIHTVQYDGFDTTWQRPTPISPGSLVPVIYMVNDPENMMAGKVSQGAADMRRRGGDIFALVFGNIVQLVVGVLGIGFLGLALAVIIPTRDVRKTQKSNPNADKMDGP